MDDVTLASVDLSHHVQRSILMDLRQNGSQAYQQIKPNGLEGNAYNYHLKMLKQAGLIAADSGVYSLTAIGNLVADAFSHSSKRMVLRTNFYIYPLVVTGGKVLVYKPKRMPTKNYFVLPSGKLHIGESFGAALERELKRRNLRLGNSDWSQVGAVNIRYLQQGKVVFHRPGIMIKVEYEGELIDSITDNGETFWVDVKLPGLDNMLPDLQAGLNLLNGHGIGLVDVERELG